MIEKFSRLLAGDRAILMPGAGDALTARIIEETGFEALFTTGYGISASKLGRPDLGYLTMTEMVERAADIIEAVDIPVFVDGDTGYGEDINVKRTVKEYERVGAVGLFIEDQVWPKRCGHMEGKKIVDQKIWLQRLEAALTARANPDFKILARTDARNISGLASAIERVQAAIELGVDAVFVESPQSREELKEVGRQVKKVPLMANMIRRGKTPIVGREELERWGYRLVAYPLTGLYAAARAMKDSLAELKEKGHSRDLPPERTLDFDDFNRLVGLEKELERWEKLR
ncbi:isocitrate lyase/PEP mutase family protein [Halarsenatibacter silvermanii]|uniref:2-Methylisocitrate lyase, PEP mutase family n=1 Tax=Halarsenatibacter silvermanii TaxID=321763 RepID=A0A1G9HC14_9FIRM|nr:isocitrate lyase/PEP mutase family protein [Halarsenatibacter silvermanii]SDL10376.1 2-Methylisocitrate lyase, PEP mutase family [Halarsenatibacter silvermanii]